MACPFGISDESDHILFDSQQRHAILVIAVQRFDDEALQIDARVVGVHVRADADVDVAVAAAVGQLGARVARQRE